MKKTYLAITLLGILAASANAAAQPYTESVPVRFTGEVRAATCKVTVGQFGNVVQLGRVDPTAGAKGVLVPVVFNFSRCQKTTIDKVSFAGGQNGGQSDDPTTGVPDKGLLATDRPYVTVQLYNDATASGQFQKEKTLSQKIETSDPSFTTIPFYARLEIDQDKAAQPGTITSAALFTVTYQ